MRLYSSVLKIMLTVFLICSCSSVPIYPDFEPVQDQEILISILEELINSQDNFSIYVLSRRTLNYRFRQTRLLTHSFYLIDLYDNGYYTLSFSGADNNPYTRGIWVLNKDTDIFSYQLFIEGNNMWNVDYLFRDNVIDSYHTLRNVIRIIAAGADYYYRDHIRKLPNALNCNTAILETIALVKH